MTRHTPDRSRRWLAGGFALALAAGAATVFAQSSNPTPRPAPVQAVPYEPLVLRVDSDSENWTLKTEVLLIGITSQDRDLPSQTPVYITKRIVADAAVIAFPVPTDTAFTVMDDQLIESKLTVNQEEVREPPRLLEGYQAGARLLAWDMTEINSAKIRLEVETAQTSFDTVVDEKRAFNVDWPKGELPEHLNSALGAQLYVESDAPEIARLVEVWTNGNPTRVKPYYLAKHLASKVVEWYQPGESPYLAHRDSDLFRTSGAVMIAGYNVRGAVVAAREQRGSALDMANLLCAVYRAAGLPARVVIGYNHEAQTDESRSTIHPWVEFFLMVDEENGLGEWVPVDIIRQREFASRTPEVTRPWKYFGNNDKSHDYSAISFHWHPPTMLVNSGPPAFWGWLPKPSAPNVDQGIRFHAFNTPMTPELQRRRRGGR